MITFNREELVKSQNENFKRIYSDVNFCVWLIWGIATIVSMVVIYFFSIAIGLCIEALVTLAGAMYYLIMSFIKERVEIGYYQRAISVNMQIVHDGIVVLEKNKDCEKKYMVSFDSIFLIKEYEKYIIIKLKDEGTITLPNSEDTAKAYKVLQQRMPFKYKILK